MIHRGTNIKNEPETDADVGSAVPSLTQLLVFNTVKRGRRESQAVHHNMDRETALPLYIGLLVHTKTRKYELIDIRFDKGLSVS